MLQAEVTLETSHIGKGCDRDTYNLASQRQLCGASDLAIDLLPDPQHVRKATAADAVDFFSDNSDVHLDNLYFLLDTYFFSD